MLGEDNFYVLPAQVPIGAWSSPTQDTSNPENKEQNSSSIPQAVSTSIVPKNDAKTVTNEVKNSEQMVQRQEANPQLDSFLPTHKETVQPEKIEVMLAIKVMEYTTFRFQLESVADSFFKAA